MKKDVFDYVWTDKKRTFLGLPWSFTRYYLTESKFITRTGIFSVQEDELELYRVLDKKLVLTMGDRIVVLDKGCIAEDGSYEELIAKDGIFAELVRRQRADVDADTI